jgi:hypothetical protein
MTHSPRRTNFVATFTSTTHTLRTRTHAHALPRFHHTRSGRGTRLVDAAALFPTRRPSLRSHRARRGVATDGDGCTGRLELQGLASDLRLNVAV